MSEIVRRWRTVPLPLRLLAVVFILVTGFYWLAGLLPASTYPLLYLILVGIGVWYGWWEYQEIRRRRDSLQRELHERRPDWKAGLPPHLRERANEQERSLAADGEDETKPRDLKA